MKDKYFEMVVTPNSFFEEIESFLLDNFNNGIEELNGSIILRSDEPFENLRKKLQIYIHSLEEIFSTNIDVKIDIIEKENKDWIKSYQESITPVEIDEFYIHPSWYDAKKDKINILIDPALAFGSGHHETTSSCVKAIKEYVSEGKSVLDVGCGSGILSIVSAKLGAEVDLCDTDELSVRSAKENFELNKETYNNIWQGSANLATKSYDVVIANIIADVLIFINRDLKKVTGDILILSGIIDKYKDRVIQKFSDFELIEMIEDNEWVTLILKKIAKEVDVSEG